MSNGRKVSTDALETLGTVIDDTQKRDAIHLAVLPMVAGQRLHAGQDIGIKNDVAMTTAKEKLGIVDPFLKEPVQKGERFWMVLYPRMVTSLRHVWSHPAFADEAGVSAPSVAVSSALSLAKETIERIAEVAEISYDEIISAADDYLSHGEYLCQGGKWEGFYLSGEFWPAYEIVSGRTVKEDDRGSFFSCSC